MKVLKFGGTSVATVESIKSVLEIVKQESATSKVCIVLSALGGVTNELIGIANQASEADETYLGRFENLRNRHFETAKGLVDPKFQSPLIAEIKIQFNRIEELLLAIFLLREVSEKTYHELVSFGERLSVRIVTHAAISSGMEKVTFDAGGIIVTENSTQGQIIAKKETLKNITNFLKTDHQIFVVPGFVAQDINGNLTTLGRGGSDYSAAIISGAIEAVVLEIWTDVNGVLTANPTAVKDAITINHLSYEEAMELSYFGAKVIYPPTIQPALEKNIPLLIKNTFNPSHPGTYISKVRPDSDKTVKGITSIGAVALITLSGKGMVGKRGVASRFFSALSAGGINVILISQASSEHSITIAIEKAQQKLAEELIIEEFQLEIKAKQIDKPKVEVNRVIVAVVGQSMRNTPGISGKLFGELGSNGINVHAIAQGTSELNISFVINKDDEHKALNVIHESFFLSERRVINVFLTGIGTVGKTFLNQLKLQRDWLLKNRKIEVRLTGLSNSKKVIFARQGINLDNPVGLLLEDGEPLILENLPRQIKKLNLRNSVFVDLTASPQVSSIYHEILDKSVSIVTANKIAVSSKYEDYKKLTALARHRKVKFLFETNVGAGLPILSTLNDLKSSGDEIVKIEAVLSGTLNYIFSEVESGAKFSDALKDAKAKGYSEPDPREDLSGMDVARKIIILARESGYEIEPIEIKVTPPIPQSIMDASCMDEFWKKLENWDADFEKLKKEAVKNKLKFRFVATLNNGACEVGLKQVGESSPLAALEGTDNLVLFYSRRYSTQPLTVKGPGAGAEVTAGGVFADVIRIV